MLSFRNQPGNPSGNLTFGGVSNRAREPRALEIRLDQDFAEGERGVHFVATPDPNVDRRGTLCSADVQYILKNVLSHYNSSNDTISVSKRAKSLRIIQELKLRYGLTDEMLQKLSSLLLSSPLMSDTMDGRRKVTDIISTCASLNSKSTLSDIRGKFFNDYVRYGGNLTHVNVNTRSSASVQDDIPIVLTVMNLPGKTSQAYVVGDDTVNLKLICRKSTSVYNMNPDDEEMRTFENKTETRVISTQLSEGSAEYKYFLTFIQEARLAAHNENLTMYELTKSFNINAPLDANGLKEVKKETRDQVMYLEFGSSIEANLIFQTRAVKPNARSHHKRIAAAFQPMCAFIAWMIESDEVSRGSPDQQKLYYGAFGGDAPLGFQRELRNLMRSLYWTEGIKYDAENDLYPKCWTMADHGPPDSNNYNFEIEHRKIILAMYVLEHLREHGRMPHRFAQKFSTGVSRTPPVIGAVARALRKVCVDDTLWCEHVLRTTRKNDPQRTKVTILDAAAQIFLQNVSRNAPKPR
ncbi:VP6 [Micromonas pusilla reovirus]|uniref:Uncharacterized protein VP6 n=1 Tax=Micromonas pusilla reovirus (isolate Netherlands/2005) TaxID=649596 RepID=VP6_MPRVN|nr:VP6 [Micromonas pusilla reovirus]Q1I0U6.1 RecName: Full=Uncharacterized protein VP6 [Micromonas pusilla reovirus (isolate Netherlands)]AAZ94046.1 VP6 [Micromonas pusilla reovirus]